LGATGIGGVFDAVIAARRAEGVATASSFGSHPTFDRPAP
jgi:hypothetical protein